jgi:crotonobetainyl-CoA:carnitine CoA-transferase CaiB-like acyl-CoA transferase
METGYGPLNGVTVIDFTHVMAGPACTMMLADMGADVIKIERVPFEEDASHNADDPYWINGVSASYMIVNRNKRGLPLNLKTPEGIRIAHRLIGNADVVVENYRPGVLDRLGVGYEAASKTNPGIIYGAVSGFGRTGPYAQRPGYDLMAQGMAGIMSVTGEGPGRAPVKPGVPMTDITGGILLAMGICAALRHRKVTGEGQMVDTSLFEAGIVQTYWHSALTFSTGQAPEPLGSGHPLQAPYQAIRTSDGYITVSAGGWMWGKFCELVDPDLEQDPRFDTNEKRMQNVKELETILNERMAVKTTAEWIAELEAAGMPSGPINTIPQMHADPQALAREMVVTQQHPVAGEVKTLGLPVKFSRTPGGPKRPATVYGQYTREILTDAGFSDAEIDGFIAAGATADGV